MPTLLVKFVVLSSSFMLLLPAGLCRGWGCCQSPSVHATLVSPVSVLDSPNVQLATTSAPQTSHSGSCCQKKAGSSALTESPLAKDSLTGEYVRATSPAHSSNDCCCTQGKPVTDNAAGGKLTSDQKQSSINFATIASAMAMEPDRLPVAVAVVSPCCAGPPLRILHCVWRC